MKRVSRLLFPLAVILMLSACGSSSAPKIPENPESDFKYYVHAKPAIPNKSVPEGLYSTGGTLTSSDVVQAVDDFVEGFFDGLFS